jgi:poly(A) polymerase/tRNA nucleotidyltransferase (CCA-adding enzyme)
VTIHTISPKIIPEEVSRVTTTLKKANFKAYLVGGCVRDLLLGLKPKDWDITTDAKPEDIQSLFEHTFYENDYGTVGIVNDGVKDKTLETIEVTPFRLDGSYSNARHPDSVTFAKTLDEDLMRRDFTINAIAYDQQEGSLIDPYKGQSDIKDKVIRAVGEPSRRFNEDALRILRAIRLATELDFTINANTLGFIRNTSDLLEKVSKERIRDEFSRIVASANPKWGLQMLQKLDILKCIAPELEKGVGIEQNQAHKYDVWEHLLGAVQGAANKGFSFEVRLAALFHDVGKPHTRRIGGKNTKYTFYGHEVVGARIVKKTLQDLKFSLETIKTVTTLVRYHMFFSDTEIITHTAVRRLLARVGKENIEELMNLRICDRIGMGRPKEEPYRFRKYKAMLEEVQRDPVSVGMLTISGDEIMNVTHETPGPRIGWILHALLEEVLEDPSLNNKKYMEDRVMALSNLDDTDLKDIGERGKSKGQEEEGREIEELRGKYHVK